MQSFLPFVDYNKSAQVLDRLRLGKMRIETLQILNCLNHNSQGWKNHPAVKMWRGYENSLVEYGLEICNEWIKRGYKDTCYGKIKAHYNYDKPNIKPAWLNDLFCLAHQSNLVRKNSEYYRKFFPNVPDNLPYIWPVK